MRRLPLQRLVSWLCLLAFAGNVLLQVVIVECSDEHGSRLEWTCSQNEQGQCVTVCGQGAPEERDPPSSPCNDRPVLAVQTQLQAAPTRADLLPLSPPLLVAVIEPFRIHLPTVCHSRPIPPVSHPPDTLGRLRSVILTV